MSDPKTGSVALFCGIIEIDLNMILFKIMEYYDLLGIKKY